MIFAESALAGDGGDWNLAELGFLGDISVVMDVTVFDEGRNHVEVGRRRPAEAFVLKTEVNQAVLGGFGSKQVAPALVEELVLQSVETRGGARFTTCRNGFCDSGRW